MCEKGYAWNPNACACSCDGDCKIFEYLKKCKYINNIVDDLVIISDEFADMSKNILLKYRCRSIN